MKITKKQALACGIIAVTSFGVISPAVADENRTGPGFKPWESQTSADFAGVPDRSQLAQEQTVGEVKVEVSPETKAMLKKLDLPADYFEQAVKVANAPNGGAQFMLSAPDIAFNDDLFKSLTPNTENLTHTGGDEDKGVGGGFVVQARNVTTSDSVTFPELAVGDKWFPFDDFRQDGKKVSASAVRSQPVFDPNEILIWTYPTSSVSDLTTSDNPNFTHLILDKYAASPERKADVLSAGNRYHDENTIVDCTVEECVIPVQFAYTGWVTDENGDVVRDPNPSVETVMSSETFEIKVTSVAEVKRPQNVGEDKAVVYKGVDPADHPFFGNMIEKGWQGSVWYTPFSDTGTTITNGGNAVEQYKPASSDHSTSGVFFNRAMALQNGVYEFDFITQLVNNTDEDIKAEYSLNLIPGDEYDAVVDGDKIVTKGVRNFSVEIKQDVNASLTSSWTPTLGGFDADGNGEYQRTVTLSDGVTANLSIGASDNERIMVDVEIIGGSDDFTIAGFVNEYGENGFVAPEGWEALFQGINNAGGGWGSSMSVLPGYAVNNSEVRGEIVPNVPTPEVPEPTPTPEVPEPTPTPEVPEPTPTPEVPEPTPTPEVPVVPEPTPTTPPVVQDVPTDSGAVTGETPTMSGASLAGPAMGLLALLSAGGALVMRKFGRKDSNRKK